MNKIFVITLLLYALSAKCFQYYELRYRGIKRWTHICAFISMLFYEFVSVFKYITCYFVFIAFFEFHIDIRVRGWRSLDPRRSIDDIDKLIEERNLPELERMVLNGDYWRLESRIFPLSSRDLERTLANLLVTINLTSRQSIEFFRCDFLWKYHFFIYYKILTFHKQ